MGTVQRLQVHWDRNATPQEGRDIQISTTRGTLTEVGAPTNTGTTITVPTNANGNATVDVTASNAGSAIIRAANASSTGSPSAQLDVEFVATTAASLVVQVTPTTIGVNQLVNGQPTEEERSTVVAVVRDANNNLVKGKDLSFSLFEDGSSGRLRSSTATTDSFGRASTEYIAGLSPSGQDGVVIHVRVVGPEGCDPADPLATGACDQTTLTVAQQSLRLTLGSSNVIDVEDVLLFHYPYTVLVTDSNGNPQAGATVELSLFTLRYLKGLYSPRFDNEDPPAFIEWAQEVNATCANEDVDRDGFKDEGEDLNGDGFLDPAPGATVITSVTTDAEGFGFFRVDYPRSNATWFAMELEARTNVAGSESSAREVFILPGLASDYTNQDIIPPGLVSPEGTGACDVPD